MTDQQLLSNFQSGDTAALCELIRRHMPMVHAAALREVRDPHLADDITQAVFLVLARRAKTLSRHVILPGWLFKTTLYAAADARKSQNRRTHHEREAATMRPTIDQPTSTKAEEIHALLNQAIATLGPADRDAVVLRYLQGQSPAVVAAALGTTENTARQRVARALERLRKHFAKQGVLLALAALVTLLDSLPAHAAAADLAARLTDVATGKAVPTPMSQTFAQGANHMIRLQKLKRNALIASAVASAGILAFCLPLALAQIADHPPRLVAAVPPSDPPPVQVAQLNAGVPVASPATPGPASAVPALSPEDAEKATVASNTAFATDLYQIVIQDKADKNLFLSPYSVSTILGLTAAGARGNTADQMKKVLHIANMDALNMGIADLAAELVDDQGGQRPYQLSVANALWDSRVYPMTPAFTALAAKYYGTSGVYMVDFAKDPEAARVQINKWVEDKTNTRIKDLLPAGPPPSITKATALVLTNAIYFKGTWQTQFRPQGTTNQPFHVTPQKDVQVSLMTNGGSFKYFENDDFQAIALPYKAVAGPNPQSASMFILLPKKADGLAALEKELTPENLAQWHSAMTFRTGQVLLPRFTITCEIKLNQVLQAMGMTDAFDIAKADLRGMATPPPGDNIFISGVFHKAFVNVDEEGTEAAAATAVAGAGGGRPTNPFVFRADHPFFFAIQYDPTRSLLFMGHVVEPPLPGPPAPVAAAPVRGGRGTPAVLAASPFKDPLAVATAASDLVKTALADTAFVSDTSHAALYQDLKAVDAAAQGVLNLATGTAAQVNARANMLSRVLNQATSGTTSIINRPSESQESKEKATQLGAKLRALVNS